MKYVMHVEITISEPDRIIESFADLAENVAGLMLDGCGYPPAVDITAVVTKVVMLEPPAKSYECKDCIGMIDHGCQCQAMNALSPGCPDCYTLPDKSDLT